MPESDVDNTPQPNFEALSLPLLSIRHFFILSVVLLIIVLLVWGLVRSNHLSVALRYEISALTKEKLDYQERNRQLKTELAAIGSLGQLEEAARNVLGLITPNQGQIVVIEP
ncbi:MAG: cell division protein FtsL [Deltaproteobacteria bacterium]|nr:cell division protein FtsL [Deltaproteobacteria bacterium]